MTSKILWKSVSKVTLGASHKNKCYGITQISLQHALQCKAVLSQNRFPTIYQYSNSYKNWGTPTYKNSGIPSYSKKYIKKSIELPNLSLNRTTNHGVPLFLVSSYLHHLKISISTWINLSFSRFIWSFSSSACWSWYACFSWTASSSSSEGNSESFAIKLLSYSSFSSEN